MPRFPYMNFPFPVYKTSFRNSADFHNFPKPYNSYNKDRNLNYTSNSNNNNCINDVPSSNIVEEKRHFANFEKKNKSNKNTDDYLFDLFGLKIYFDDVLLVSLIYFLYSEDVKDDGLFIVLILLLLN